MVSFGEAALGLPSTGSYPSKTTGHLASPGKSKEKSSENSTNHVEPGEEVSSPLKKKQAPTQRNAEGGSSVKKCDIDGNSGQQQWKRKPATDGEVYIGGAHDHNSPPGNSTALVPSVRRAGVSAEKVNDLFIQGTRVWNELLVRDVFTALEAEEVLKIKPGTHMPTDVSGCYGGVWRLGIVVRKKRQMTWSASVGTRCNNEICIGPVGGLGVAQIAEQAAGARPSMAWKCPDEGWVKVNTDAAFDSDSCTGSAGVVIRDHCGRVLAEATRRLEQVPDALTAEAMAAKEGMELAVEHGFGRVVLEVDSSELKMLLESADAFRSPIGGLCFDITDLGKICDMFRVFWVGRQANSVAHDCASWGMASAQSLFSSDYIPEWLLGLAAADCNLASN
ncbi:hypothetical protein C2845_PM17G09400 [Panicum miliaceum]|uniref:RNase H type-1 domain-containing protein n=1 Tax=Panicum miliaceum TaxID=4540 RepID=A0A3L6PZN0_PANMI|nr:hypothetical protein C2845_PM17G09400 [Panicum miliaceum]